MHTKFGTYLISVILGIGLSSIFRKTCDDKDCLEFKGPHHDDIVENIYKHNKKCFKYNSSTISCNSKHTQVHYA